MAINVFIVINNFFITCLYILSLFWVPYGTAEGKLIYLS